MHEDLRRRILVCLERVYGDGAPAIMTAIDALLARYAGAIPAREQGWSARDALLITYADTLVGDAPPLQTLQRFLPVSYTHLTLPTIYSV